MNTEARVVVIGGGFAGLETIFYLRHKLKDRVDLTLISDSRYFVFKPNTIYIPFGEDPNRFMIDLTQPTKQKNIQLVVEQAKDLDLSEKKVITNSGEIPYDYLVIATGAAMRPDEIPGLSEHALSPWTIEDMLRLRYSLLTLRANAKRREIQKLLFLVPPNNKCSGPLYELAFMIETWLSREGARDRVEITWSTFEEGYIQAFGPRLNTVVSDEFYSRHITGHKGYIVTEVEPGVVSYQNGQHHKYDLLISFPPYIAKENFNGLPSDERGFVHVESDSRRIRGLDSVFAVGDVTDFPIKQAFLALLQGDAAAEHINAEVTNSKPDPEFRFEPVSMCVMEELNKATFAQVPLKYTFDPLKPVTVNNDDPTHYKVGVSPLWRVGKKALGLYLPWRFGHGEPFHAGLAWDAMDMGLKVMSKLFAR